MEKIEQIIQSKTEFSFFWGANDPESNFHQPVFFTDGKNVFNSSEQYFMLRKAEFFNDEKAAIKIMEATDPAVQKQEGRKIKPFVRGRLEPRLSPTHVRGCILKVFSKRIPKNTCSRALGKRM